MPSIQYNKVSTNRKPPLSRPFFGRFFIVRRSRAYMQMGKTKSVHSLGPPVPYPMALSRVAFLSPVGSIMKQNNADIEQYRIRSGKRSSSIHDGNNGAFRVPIGLERKALVIASDGEGWEHVSVSFKKRTPTWSEMCKIKHLFWTEDEMVIQYHPAKGDYVNCHPHCLHLWRPINLDVPRPPGILVGLTEALR